MKTPIHVSKYMVTFQEEYLKKAKHACESHKRAIDGIEWALSAGDLDEYAAYREQAEHWFGRYIDNMKELSTLTLEKTASILDERKVPYTR